MNRFCQIALGVAALTIGLPRSALACDQWDISKANSIRQANGIAVTTIFAQSGPQLSGTAEYFSNTLTAGGDRIAVHGSVSGTVVGNQARFKIAWYVAWKDCLVGICKDKSWQGDGVYEGTIDPNGHVEGQNWDYHTPGTKFGWYIPSPLICADASAPPPSAPPPAKPIVHIIHSIPSKAPARCLSGYVWRVAGPNDLVCVPPESRDRTAAENARGPSLVDPNGAWGPQSCIQGYVWREAFSGDLVCVTPDIRDLVREENALGPSRMH